jgi:hypothetical protein
MICAGIINLTAVSCWPQNGDAFKKKFNNTGDVEKWMQVYYQNPDAQSIVSAIKTVLADEELMKDHSRNIGMIHFFAAALQSNKSKLTEIGSLVEEPWGDKREFTRRIIDETENFKPAGSGNPEDIDCLWAEFMATGKDEPIKTIFKVLTYSPGRMDMSAPFWQARGIHLDETALEVMQDAARDSLVANAARDKYVYGILKSEAQASKSWYMKSKLQDILYDADQRKDKEK